MPRMFVSKVETGLRFAMPTMVWAARWMTVSISCSPSTRSRVAWWRTSPRTTFTQPIDPLRTSSLCGTQSRTRQTTSAPSACRRLTSHPPTSPVAPVTSVGRSRQNAREASVISRPSPIPER